MTAAQALNHRWWLADIRDSLKAREYIFRLCSRAQIEELQAAGYRIKELYKLHSSETWNVRIGKAEQQAEAHG